MLDFKEMYFELVEAQTEAISMLHRAQMKIEAMYASLELKRMSAPQTTGRKQIHQKDEDDEA